MTTPDSRSPGPPDETNPEDVKDTRRKGKLLALGSGAGCLILGTVPVSLFIIFGIGYYLLRGCS